MRAPAPAMKAFELAAKSLLSRRRKFSEPKCFKYHPGSKYYRSRDMLNRSYVAIFVCLVLGKFPTAAPDAGTGLLKRGSYLSPAAL